jgi:predicted nucleic-acid-binding Zn-ribbon protein
MAMSYAIDLCPVFRILNVGQDLIAISAFAFDLSRVRSLANYETAIKPRLKSPAFFKVQHEIYVASRCARSNYHSEFIQPSSSHGQRTSDLKLSTQWGDIYVEGTKKARYHSDDSGRGESWQSVWQLMAQVLSETGANHEVFIFTLGTEIFREDVIHLGNIVRENISSGDERVRLLLDRSCGVLVRRLPPMPCQERLSVFLPAHMNPGFAFVNIGVDEQGAKQITSYNRIGLISINSHRISSVINTFNSKRQRKQIPDDSIGLIYIDVDIDQAKSNLVPVYLELIGAVLETKLSSGGNSRIGAVVLTAGPVFIESIVDDKPFITLRRHLKDVRNPSGSLPDGFVIP